MPMSLLGSLHGVQMEQWHDRGYMSDITIICTRERGLHRGGVFHPSGAKTWPLKQFTPEQLAEIKEDRRLMVKDESSFTMTVPATVEDAIKDVVSILCPFVEVTEKVVTETIAGLVAKKQATEEKEDDSVAGDDELSPEPILPRSRKRGARNAQ